GGGEAGITPHRDHARAAARCQLRSAVGRAVIYYQHLADQGGLCRHADQQALQQLAPVPHRYNGADAHRKKRFFARNHRFWNPSRQGFSFFSPSRDEYRIEISPKRMRELRSASILISSENAMPSDSSFIPPRMERRRTHMPDWESRTHRKNS